MKESSNDPIMSLTFLGLSFMEWVRCPWLFVRSVWRHNKLQRSIDSSDQMSNQLTYLNYHLNSQWSSFELPEIYRFMIDNCLLLKFVVGPECDESDVQIRGTCVDQFC